MKNSSARFFVAASLQRVSLAHQQKIETPATNIYLVAYGSSSPFPRKSLLSASGQEDFSTKQNATSDNLAKSLNKLVFAKKYDEAETLFQDQYSKFPTFKPSRDVFNQMLNSYKFGGNLNKMVELFSKMSDAGVAPDVVSYTSLIDAFGKSGNLTAAKKYFYEMQKVRIQPNVVTYNAMLHTLGKLADVRAMNAMYEDMRKAGIKPDLYTFTTMMGILGDRGEIPKMLDLLEMMQRYNLAPNNVVYSMIIHAFGKKGDSDSQRKYLEIMEKKGMKPNGVTFSSIVHNACVRGNISFAMEMFKKMHSSGVPIKLQTFNTILEALGKKGDVTSQSKIITIMGYRHVDFNQNTIEALIDGYSREKETTAELSEQLLDFFERWKKMQTAPNTDIFARLIQGFLNCKRADLAETMLNECKSVQLEPSTEMYELVIGALSRRGQFKKCRDIMQQATQEVTTNDGRTRKRLKAKIALAFLHPLHLHKLTPETTEKWKFLKKDVSRLIEDREVDGMEVKAEEDVYMGENQYRRFEEIIDAMLSSSATDQQPKPSEIPE